MKTTIRNILLGALLAIGLGVPYLQAADVAISALPAGAALGGTEAIPAVQSGATVKTTPAAIKTYVETSPLYLGASAYLYSGTANVIEQRNSTTAQTLQVFDTYTDSSNYARIALNTSLTGDWVQVAAQTAGTAGDNYSIALTPTGTGAISAQVPDSGIGGGNARGANAVDWSTGTRTAATQVASGAASTIAGGRASTASGADSAILGGSGHSTSGFGATVGGGGSNIGSGDYSAVTGGYQNTASGNSAWVPGGRQATTRGLYGAGAYSSGQRSAVGDAQVILQPVRRTTTDATPVSLATDGTPAATTVMVLPADSTLMCTAMVVAQSASATNNAGYEIKAVVQRDGANNMALVGTATTTTVAEDTAGMDATIIANDTLESAQIQVTGVAATTKIGRAHV